MKKMILFGHGYVSTFLIPLLTRLGWHVVCTSRRIPMGKPLEQGNLTLVHFLDPILPSFLNSCDILLSTVPPENNKDPVLQEYGSVLRDRPSSCIKWVGYLSSTSVYGDHDGAWVNETTPCDPSDDKGKERLSVENQWMSLYESLHLPIHIFRLSGIYGPGRNCLEDILKGKDWTLLKKNHCFSRIHIDDICQVILHSIHAPTPGEWYNVTDHEPAPLHVVQQFGAALLGKGPLREIEEEHAILSENFKRFFKDNKKVCGKKIIQTLGVQLLYPQYRSGLSQGCLPSLPLPHSGEAKGIKN